MLNLIFCHTLYSQQYTTLRHHAQALASSKTYFFYFDTHETYRNTFQTKHLICTYVFYVTEILH
jgi:hypothetical protein